MAWEWVAPVATATVGVAGIFGTWLTGRQGRDDAKAIASEKLSHERLLSKEAREQQRLENAYVDLLDMTERVGQWAQMAYPRSDTHQPVPDMPPPEEQAHTGALVKAFGSDEVRERMETWRTVVLEVIYRQSDPVGG